MLKILGKASKYVGRAVLRGLVATVVIWVPVLAFIGALLLIYHLWG